MNIHNVIKRSKVNGPGTRYTIWFQGCSIKCKGCANKHMWKHGEGREITASELFMDIMKEKDDIDGISITGGEPLDQYEDLMALLGLCKTEGIEVFLTTGHTMAEIAGKYPRLLEVVDILIDGPYEQDKLDETPAWRGSTNQGINLLTERAEKYENYEPEFTTEMIFKEDGNMTVTGFTVPKFIKGETDETDDQRN